MIILISILGALAAVFIILTLIAVIKKPISVYKNKPAEQNPMEGKKVRFVENEDFCVTKNLSEVTVVYDMGEWYHIHFGCKYDRWARFICQKDLIQGATIEEFEKLFENKIVRKFSAKKN